MKLVRKYCLFGAGLLVFILLLSACSQGGEADESSDPASSVGASEQARALELNTLTSYELLQAPQGTEGEPASTQRLIIKNGNLRLQVSDSHAAANQITEIAAQYGGYVLASQANNEGERRTASITVTVEVAYFETAIEDIQMLAERVLSVASSGEDVNDEFVDAESRLRNLEATRDRIRTFLEQASNVEEALLVNNELSRIEGEIEQAKGRMNYLAGRAAYSTITVNLREESDPETGRDWSPGSTIKDALSAQADLLRVLGEVGIWLVIVGGPYFLIAGIVLASMRWWNRRRKPDALPIEPPA